MIICREMIRLGASTKLLVVKLSESITGFPSGHMQSWSSPAGWSFLTSAVRPMFTSTMLDLSLSILRMLTSGMSLAKRTPRASQRTFSLPQRSTSKSMGLKHLRICLTGYFHSYVQFGYHMFMLSLEPVWVQCISVFESFSIWNIKLLPVEKLSKAVKRTFSLVFKHALSIWPFVLIVLITLQAGKSRKSSRHANGSYWMQSGSLVFVMFGIKECMYMMFWLNFC